MRKYDSVITDNDQRRLRNVLGRVRRSAQSDASQILGLGERISRSRVVGSTDVPRNVVTMNSIVTLRNLDSGDRLTCLLVYPDDARTSARAVSVSRPLGQAMLGKRVGQIIHWPSGARVRRLRIQSVLYQPEAAGDLHL